MSLSRAGERLPRREREILDAVFALGNDASADAIRTRLVDPPSYSAVRAMLARLERKGFLKHRQDGPRYVYSARATVVTARRAAPLSRCLLWRIPESADYGVAGRRTVD